MKQKYIDIILISAAGLSVACLAYKEYKRMKAFKTFRNTVGVDDVNARDTSGVTVLAQDGRHLCTEGTLRELEYGLFNGLCD